MALPKTLAMRSRAIFACLIVCLFVGDAKSQSREEKVRGDREKVLADGYWRYNDFAGGLVEAQKTGKPIIVVLRCIPCEECVKLDEDLMEKDPILRPLLDQYVRVRIVGTNGLDLGLFQYDYDQSFAVFLLNADKTIYARFGTRSHRTDWTSDVSISGLAEAMSTVLKLHERYPANQSFFAGKTGDRPLFASPEKFPSLKDKYTATLNYDGNVVQSCIHCHQIGDAQKSFFRDKSQAIPTEYLFPYPHPKILGLIMDPATMHTVASVEPGSLAEKAGIAAGDELQLLNGQAVLSIADIQWVLHHLPQQAEVSANIKRKGISQVVSMTLPEGWREQDDLSWRVSSWPLRRMVTGGIVLETATPAQRDKAGLKDREKMGLHVKFVGRYGPHAAAKKAGVKMGDIVVAYDGRDNLMRETDLLSYGAQELMPGEKVDLRIVRDGKIVTITIPVQE